MDEADMAQEAESVLRAAALAAAGTPVQCERQLLVAGRVTCLECGEPIPAERLEAIPGACRCVECQRDWEG